MEPMAAKHSDLDTSEDRCIVCGARLHFDTWCCPACARNGLSSQQYAELFWDEA